jgi:hypothetical protein
VILYRYDGKVIHDIEIFMATPCLDDDSECYFEQTYPDGDSYMIYICKRCGRIMYAPPLVSELYCRCGRKMTKSKESIYLKQVPCLKTHVWGSLPVYWRIDEEDK